MFVSSEMLSYDDGEGRMVFDPSLSYAKKNKKG